MMRLKQGWKNLWEDQRGIGTVEMILILVENPRHSNLMCFV